MGFFDDQAVTPARPEATVIPEWLRPGTHHVGAPLPHQSVMFNNGAIAVVVCGLLAYPTGLQFQIQVRWTNTVDRDVLSKYWSPIDGIRRSVVLADGTKLVIHERTGLGWPPPQPDNGFSIVNIGGGGDDTRIHVTSWIYPLPTDGPLTFITQWPQAGIPETKITVDIPDLSDYARRCIELWPVQSP